jgi:glycosyltransferase involved in cell wall biosynthesis
MKPLISVIIPAYNCEGTIATAIDSISNQTYKNIEIIVVDDKSTDRTKEIVINLAKNNPKIRLYDGQIDPHRFDVKLNRNINAGWSARNTGLEQVKGEYITFQDADDACFLNRIEVQYDLLKKYDSTHLTLNWVQFNEKYIGKKLRPEPFVNSKIILPSDLYKMSQRSKGLIAKISSKLNTLIPFHIKRKRIINKLFFGSLENYPGAGNSPLFKSSVIEKVKFRKLSYRVWPSFMGRGADKDFNFQVAETFKNSHVIYIPLYMWRVNDQNPKYMEGLDEFIY